MVARRVWGAVALIAFVALIASGGPIGAQAQGGDDLAALRAEVIQHYSQGKYADAIPIAERYVVSARQKHGEEHEEFATAISWLANVYQAEGRYAEAEPLIKRAIAIYEKALGPEHPEVAIALNNLAELYRAEGRYPKAEPLYKRALTILEKALGSDLAELYRTQSRYAEAEPLYKRALAIKEKALGTDHPDVAQSLNNLAEFYRVQGRYAEAEPLYKRTMAIFEKAHGSEHPDVAITLNNLALLYHTQGRYAEAEPLDKRALAIKEKALGPEHPSVGISLNNLAELYRAEGRYAEAEPLYKRTVAIFEKAHGPEHPDVATELNNLAWLALAQVDWAQAADYWRHATTVIERRAARGLAGPEGRSVKGEAVRNSDYFFGLVKMTDRLAPQGQADRARQGREMFEKAQWVQASEAASSLAQMAARSAKGDAALAVLVRERQDLVAEWRFKDKQLIGAKSELPAKRDPNTEKSLSARLASIDTRLAAIDARFAKDFPDFASLSSPKPASVAEVQTLLRNDEALILFLDTPEFPQTPEETFIWVVTNGDMRWVKSDLGTKALMERVVALRCGLDAALWDDERYAAGCSGLVKAVPEPDAFDNIRAEWSCCTTTGQAKYPGNQETGALGLEDGSLAAIGNLRPFRVASQLWWES
jgi:tetratricopeptide (TPR) repeat protein